MEVKLGMKEKYQRHLQMLLRKHWRPKRLKPYLSNKITLGKNFIDSILVNFLNRVDLFSKGAFEALDLNFEISRLALRK